MTWRSRGSGRVESVGCRSVSGWPGRRMSLLGSPVGGRHAGHAQKGEQVRALPGQAVQQSAVRRVAGRPGHEPVHRGLQHRHLSGQRGVAKLLASRPCCSTSACSNRRGTACGVLACPATASLMSWWPRRSGCARHDVVSARPCDPAGRAVTRWPVARRNQGGYAARMSDATSPISPPPKPPEREAEIRQLLAQVAKGDLSGTIPWEEVAAELGLPGRRGS